MKFKTTICATTIAVTLAACGGSTPTTYTSNEQRMSQGGASHQSTNSLLEAQMDIPLRLDQIPSSGALSTSNKNERIRLGNTSPGLTIDTSSREAVRLFYNRLYAAPVAPPMGWTGNYSIGDAGTISLAFQNFTLQRINWYRAMAGVPANVTLSADLNAIDQQTAFLMSVNGKLSHFPESNWTLYSDVAANGASHSLLTLGQSGADAVTGYIFDYGSNNAAAGHRRWLLYPQNKTVGTGDVPAGTYKGTSVPTANALWAYDENYSNARPPVRDDYVAWPPRGYVPYQVTFGRWSFSYPSANFSTTSVTVTKDGVNIPITYEPQESGMGENTIVWLLAGTDNTTISPKVSSDQRYSVTVAGVGVNGKSRTFNYDVIIFDPDVPTPGAAVSAIALPASIDPGAKFPAQITKITGGTGFSAIQYQRKPWATNVFNTSNAIGHWIAPTTGVTGNNFALRHTTPKDDSLIFNHSLLGHDKPSISFTRFLGLVTPDEILKLQVTSDDGFTWRDAYSESGTASAGSQTINVDLSAYSGMLIKFRFVITSNPNKMVYTCDTCGWNLSDITLSHLDDLINPQTFDFSSGSTSADLSIASAGDYVLFGRTQFQNSYYSDWGPGAFIHVNGANLSGPLSNYTITNNAGTYVITDTIGRDGVQTIANPKRIDFTDVSLAFDTDGNAGAAYRLYQAAFNRKPDLVGIGFWIKNLDNGLAIKTVASYFASSPEFKSMYGANPTKDQIITALYSNVLHRAPDPGGYTFWMNALNNGYSVEEVLIYFADSPENRVQVAPSIASGIQYKPYK